MQSWTEEREKAYEKRQCMEACDFSLLKNNNNNNKTLRRYALFCSVMLHLLELNFWLEYPQFEHIGLGWKIKNKFRFYLAGNEINSILRLQSCPYLQNAKKLY